MIVSKGTTYILMHQVIALLQQTGQSVFEGAHLTFTNTRELYCIPITGNSILLTESYLKQVLLITLLKIHLDQRFTDSKFQQPPQTII